MKRHAMRRAHERYGVSMSPCEYGELVEQIHEGRALLLERRSAQVSVFAVRFRHHTLAALYRKPQRAIATFLPPRWAGIRG